MSKGHVGGKDSQKKKRKSLHAKKLLYLDNRNFTTRVKVLLDFYNFHSSRNSTDLQHVQQNAKNWQHRNEGSVYIF